MGQATSSSAIIPDFKEDTTVNGDMKVYAVWLNLLEGVFIKFDKNGGEGDMPTKRVTKGVSYTLPACEFTAPFDKVFDKWEVTVGTAAPVYKQPGETIVASDNVTVKAIWKNNLSEVPLNASGNVYAKLDSAKNVNISAKNTSGDMKIET